MKSGAGRALHHTQKRGGAARAEPLLEQKGGRGGDRGGATRGTGTLTDQSGRGAVRKEKKHKTLVED